MKETATACPTMHPLRKVPAKERESVIEGRAAFLVIKERVVDDSSKWKTALHQSKNGISHDEDSSHKKT